MFALAWIFLADQPAYRTGVIIVGLARCIAMVLVWNDIALGDRAGGDSRRLQRLFQVAYSLLGYFYLTLLPAWLGFDTQGFEVGIWEARTVLVFLGILLAAGYLTRRIGVRRRGREWYEARFVPRIAPITLYGLLFTIVLLFAIQGDEITSEPLDVALIAAPLLVYFALMWAAGFVAGRLLGFPYPQTAALSFTVASNDFELAIAVAVGVFGAASGQALAGVVGPLIEVPVLVALVYVALWLRRRPCGRCPRRRCGGPHRPGRSRTPRPPPSSPVGSKPWRSDRTDDCGRSWSRPLLAPARCGRALGPPEREGLRGRGCAAPGTRAPRPLPLRARSAPAGGRYVIEQAPAGRADPAERGVVAVGAVGARFAGRFRLFRYEIRSWHDGVIPDVAEAVASPLRLTDDPDRARRLLELVPRARRRPGAPTNWTQARCGTRTRSSRG